MFPWASLGSSQATKATMKECEKQDENKTAGVPSFFLSLRPRQPAWVRRQEERAKEARTRMSSGEIGKPVAAEGQQRLSASPSPSFCKLRSEDFVSRLAAGCSEGKCRVRFALPLLILSAARARFLVGQMLEAIEC